MKYKSIFKKIKMLLIVHRRKQYEKQRQILINEYNDMIKQCSGISDMAKGSD